METYSRDGEARPLSWIRILARSNGNYGGVGGSAIESRYAKELSEVVAWVESGAKPTTITVNNVLAAEGIRADKQNFAIRAQYDGSVEMGTVEEHGRNWERQHEANRQWEFGRTVSLRLLLRRGMLEAYLDDHFMECWTMGCHHARNVTIAVPGQANDLPVKEMKIWHMTLDGWQQ